MKAPKFWNRNGIISNALLPFSFIYKELTQLRIKKAIPYKSKIPVICIGNINLGGGGKTPTCLAIAEMLRPLNVHFLSRGYKGTLNNIIVSPNPTANEVGDEPLLLRNHAPVVIASDRKNGAEIAIKNGAEVIIMDDGFQNPHLHKDFSIIVIDGNAGFGNGKIFPAGPLRETLESGLKRANAILMIGENTNIKQQINDISDIPIFIGKIIPNKEQSEQLKNKKVIAFAGIARPDKFYKTLTEIGADIIETFDFEDHHYYTDNEIKTIIQKANELGAIPITTAKDYVKIPKTYQKDIKKLEITLEIDKVSVLNNLIKEAINV